jgi:hypothetical protein
VGLDRPARSETPPCPNEQSACSVQAPKGYRSVSVLERSSASTLLERLEPLEQASSSLCACVIPQASSTRFPGSKRWRASIRRSNGKFFPTIPDDSTGFEASWFAQKTLFFLGAGAKAGRHDPVAEICRSCSDLVRSDPWRATPDARSW